ncbi:hypothetical protein AAF712_014368 [Marasmius tenuissimus]|uniref:Uncharacterized protein n=1 Tax=Marasmius tenuissimus TaxID=585030 RepID=A0ABR2ZCD5_9AGAR
MFSKAKFVFASEPSFLPQPLLHLGGFAIGLVPILSFTVVSTFIFITPVPATSLASLSILNLRGEGLNPANRQIMLFEHESHQSGLLKSLVATSDTAGPRIRDGEISRRVHSALTHFRGRRLRWVKRRLRPGKKAWVREEVVQWDCEEIAG